MADKQYVVIGAGIAGVSAAEAIRRQDADGEITLLSGERDLPYARPMLSKAPLLSLELKQLTLHPAEWYRERGIRLISVALDAPADAISALSGKIGRLEGVTAKTVYAPENA